MTLEVGDPLARIPPTASRRSRTSETDSAWRSPGRGPVVLVADAVEPEVRPNPLLRTDAVPLPACGARKRPGHGEAPGITEERRLPDTRRITLKTAGDVFLASNDDNGTLTGACYARFPWTGSSLSGSAKVDSES
jgi:hypothetical protein